MKYKVKFMYPTQVFIIEANHYMEIIRNFEELNKGFYVRDIRDYGRIIKCNVYDCFDKVTEKIKISYAYHK